MNAVRTFLTRHFETRTLRERLLIAGTALAATWGVWLVTIGGGLMDEHKEREAAIVRTAQELRRQDAQMAALRSAQTAPEKQRLRVRQQDLLDRLQALRGDIDQLLAGFVAPERVPLLLEDMLKQHQGLKLVRLTSQPPEPLLFEQPQADEATPGDQSAPQIFRHPVQLVFEGGYMDVLAYLDAIEQGEWQLAWRRLEYEVVSYPNAKVFIEIETLSRHEEWIGV